VEFFKEGVPEEENKFWKQLLCFLDSSAAQNEILMGYFEKVINNLYNGNKAKVTICLWRQQESSRFNFKSFKNYWLMVQLEIF